MTEPNHEVERFTPSLHQPSGEEGDQHWRAQMSSFADGQWVRHSDFEKLKEEVKRLSHPGSCTCIAVPGYRGEIQWEDCPYHRAAKERPFDHSIAWNCPTYYDGCNCKKGFRLAKAQALAEVREALQVRIEGEKRGYRIAKQGGDMNKGLGHHAAQEAYESVLWTLEDTQGEGTT